MTYLPIKRGSHVSKGIYSKREAAESFVASALADEYPFNSPSAEADLARSRNDQ
jgi:hypothetical protein